MLYNKVKGIPLSSFLLLSAGSTPPFCLCGFCCRSSTQLPRRRRLITPRTAIAQSPPGSRPVTKTSSSIAPPSVSVCRLSSRLTGRLFAGPRARQVEYTGIREESSAAPGDLFKFFICQQRRWRWPRVFFDRVLKLTQGHWPGKERTGGNCCVSFSN